MRIIIIAFICFCSARCVSQNLEVTNSDSLVKRFIYQKQYNIDNYLSDTVIVEDLPIKVVKKLTKKSFIKKYWKNTINIYYGSDFIVKKGKEINSIDLYNHCNRHKIEIEDDGKIKKLTIEMLYKRDGKIKTPDCK